MRTGPSAPEAGGAQVAVVERRYRCGCMTAHSRTQARDEAVGYLAEAEYCERAMGPASEKAGLRARKWPMELEDPDLVPYLRRQEALEREMAAHRAGAGIVSEVVRLHEPANLATDNPKPAPAPNATSAAKPARRTRDAGAHPRGRRTA